MKRKIITTADGSTTIQIEDWNEQYHSKHGAIQEAKHVFLEMGLQPFLTTEKLSILEIGFGTGLNALLAALEVINHKTTVYYTGVEAFPVEEKELSQLNYHKSLPFLEAETIFKALHHAAWEKPVEITSNFTLHKQQLKFEAILAKNTYQLIYFDAFGIRVQPHLWEASIFKKMYDALTNAGVLVTYAANGKAKRAMKSVGFLVEKLPGPPGKREMLRATKQLL
ncbi:tRNA U34 5-methylaminomethyl-2-thiouridine-forming methyltransferase MnmC [Mesonia hippocampi]|uniref:tRNA U34 5-methylaminomethyl-2-thiouridine-forming methyltransferase MnmC n=1 Tax=Mesonia hippocampi TaxID=1628250 RepID=A0A840EPM7_9FLAO|nr:tRNA (5-methylaminomethyl-2-thiouridine)(34)-methyltransferase MnmD [Mesonia hippocampi]MBB4118940.1 tRNA U34 5-methylaminomethyl-2-thiouridine-forming methyltransferase MnmC [Mesonia hippocampi]